MGRAADPIKPDLRGSELQVFIENDLFAGTDRYYTNGIKFGFGASGSVLAQLLNVPTGELLDTLAAQTGEHPHFGLFLGQNLYTPRNIRIVTPQPLDRPWAAWLYLGGSAQLVHAERLHTVEIDVGVVGPAALGEPVQSGWHRLIGVQQPLGWNNQIRTEPGFLVSYLQKRKYGSSNGVEFVPHAGVTIGTILTLARAGGIVRIGRNMTGFGPDTIEPGGAMLQNTRGQQPCQAWRLCEWFGFVGADYRWVGHNIFLDGTVFQSGPGVDRRINVHDFSAGLSARIGMARLSFTRVMRSEEFTTAAGAGGRQSFHSLNVGVEF